MTYHFYDVKYRVLRYDHNFKRWSESGYFNFKKEAEGFIQRNKSSDRYQVIKITHTQEIVLDTDHDE